MGLKPKCRSRGRPFPKGYCGWRNGSGKPFIKLAQRLSVVAADSLSECAPDEGCAVVGLPAGSTKAKVVVEACYRAAAQGDVAAARALFEFTEAAKVRVDTMKVLNVDSATMFARARERLQAIAEKIPARLPAEVKP